jgi:hypothetical protein
VSAACMPPDKVPRAASRSQRPPATAMVPLIGAVQKRLSQACFQLGAWPTKTYWPDKAGPGCDSLHVTSHAHLLKGGTMFSSWRVQSRRQ